MGTISLSGQSADFLSKFQIRFVDSQRGHAKKWTTTTLEYFKMSKKTKFAMINKFLLLMLNTTILSRACNITITFYSL